MIAARMMGVGSLEQVPRRELYILSPPF
jgi:hypothetical protein